MKKVLLKELEMKKVLLSALLLVFGCTVIFADYVEIGSNQGWANYLPTFGARSNGWTNFVIRSSDLGQSSIFNEIQFNISEIDSPGILTNQSIYFKETSSNEASVNYPYPDLVASGYTKVFEGSFDLTSTGWTSILLDLPFEYNGTSNLDVFVKNQDSNYVAVSFAISSYYTNSCAFNQMYGFTFGDGEFTDYIPHLKLGKASTVNIIGRVINNSNSPLSATLTLDGPVQRTANTNSNGMFSVTNVVPNFSYNLNISSTGYQSADLLINVGANNHSTGNIVLIEPFNIVTNLVDDNMEIDWSNIPVIQNLSSYNLFRIDYENLTNHDNWQLIGENVNSSTFTDSLWNTLESGFYKYAIECLFSNGLTSHPTFSEWVNKEDLIEVSLYTTDAVSNSLSGTTITLVSSEVNQLGEFTEYESITNENGISILTIVPNNYQLTISRSGYSIFTQYIDLFSSSNYTFDLQEIAYPPIAVVAQDEGSFCSITWNSVDSINNTWISKGSNNNYGSIGTGAAVSFDVSHRFDESELVDYQNMYISTMKIFPRELLAEYTLKIWTGSNGNIEIFSQPIETFINDAWNEYTLNQLVEIPSSGAIYIGYTVNTTTGYPAGYDFGPHVNGGNLMRMYNSNQWESLYSINSSLDGNWNIKALLTTDITREIAQENYPITMKKNNPNTTLEQFSASNYLPILFNEPIINRDFIGYNVWRLNNYEQENEATWDLLTTTPTTELSYEDYMWSSQEPGVYLYAVKSVYSNENFSIPKFSNTVLNNVFGSIEGFVLAEDGFPVGGALITIGSNSQTTDDFGSYSFSNLDIGTYTVVASASGYNTEQQEIEVFAEQTTIANFTLGEIVYEFYDNFESYTNFSLSANPWIFTDVDQSSTYTINGVSFPNSGSSMAYIVFNPDQTTPPVAGGEAHSGNKYLASFAASNPPNNDWLISPLLEVGSFGNVSFWAKSYTTSYGMERFKVHISTGSTSVNSFTQISTGSYTEAGDQWTQFSYNLDNYAGQNIRIAIQCTSNDAFIFMVDDFKFTTSGDITDYTTLTGQLVSQDNNAGIEGQVSIQGFANFAVNTDANGNFIIGNIPKNHSYTLTANAVGYETHTTQFVSSSSNLDLGFISLIEALVPPTQVVAQLNDDIVNISWVAPATIRLTNDLILNNAQEKTMNSFKRNSFMDIELNREPDRALLGYNIYRFLASNIYNQNLWTLLNQEINSEANYTDQNTSMLNGNYKYAVKTVYSGNRLSEPGTSNIVSIINEEIAPPQNLVATVTGQNVTLNWSAPSREAALVVSENTRTRALTGYKIYRENTLISTVAANILTYTDAALDFGDYEYYVTATYTEGESVPSNTANVSIVEPEELIPPMNLIAAVNNQDVTLNWLAPGTVLPDEITEGFEGSWPPTGWTTTVNNTTQSFAQYGTVAFTTGDVVPTEGAFQAGLMWDYAHQDEWLITPEISNVSNLTFDYYGSTGSTHGDNYFVKVSTDNGSTWTPVWNASTLPEGENHYATPISINLSAYATQTIKVAWNFVDGDGQGLLFA
ncbi:MAG: carboxypeptidase regulatory-like domain-containing protein, partial [Candidatus Cloacimonadales bacterium]